MRQKIPEPLLKASIPDEIRPLQSFGGGFYPISIITIAARKHHEHRYHCIVGNISVIVMGNVGVIPEPIANLAYEKI